MIPATVYDWHVPVLPRPEVLDSPEILVLRVLTRAAPRLEGPENVSPGWACSRGVQMPALEVLAGVPDPGVGVAVYDPEGWDETPEQEQERPLRAMAEFAALARAMGLRPAAAPSPTLLEAVPGTDRIERYVRRFAPAAKHLDLLDLQIQLRQRDPEEYERLARLGARLARDANPGVEFCVQLSTNPNPRMHAPVPVLVECAERVRAVADRLWLILDLTPEGRADSVALATALLGP